MLNSTNYRLKTRVNICARFCLTALLLAMAVLGRIWAQAPIQGRFSDFTVPTPADDSGNKRVLKGAQAKQLGNGLVEIQKLTVTTSRGDEPDITIEAPHCIYDTRTSIAYSEGELSVQTADRRFAIRGRGFQWQHNESRLVISNQVQSVVRNALLKTDDPAGRPASPSPSTTAAAPEVAAGADETKITSDQFDFMGDIVRFRGNVRAAQQNATLSCGLLVVYFARDTGRLDRAEATEIVEFQRDNIRARGEKAVFTANEQRVRLTGKASWQSGDREGTGETIVLDTKTRAFRIEGGTTVKLAPQAMLPLNWFDDGATNNAANSQPLTISADILDSVPHMAVFRGNVIVSDGQGAKLTCGIMTNLFSEADGKLTIIVADGGVDFSHGQTMARGSRAIYSADDNIVSLIGQPSWKFPQGEGQSDRLKIHPDTKQIEADGNVSMKLEASNSIIDVPVPGQQNVAVPAAETQPVSTHRWILVSARELYYKPGSAIFMHSVRVQDPALIDRDLKCELLAAFFSEPGNKLDQLVADEDVKIKQGDALAVGAKATYWVGKGMIELVGNAERGNPEIRTSKRRYVAERFIMDRGRQLFRMQGPWRIEMDKTREF